MISSPRALRSLLNVAVIGCLCAVSSKAANMTFTSPTAGSVYAIGSVIHIEFVVDSGVYFGNQVLALSVNGGMTYATLKLSIPGDDTVSLKRHYDWVVPASLEDVFGNFDIPSTISSTCVWTIRPYPGGIGKANGISPVFAIVDSPNAIKNGFRAGKEGRIAVSSTAAVSASRIPGSLFSIDGRVHVILPLSRDLPTRAAANVPKTGNGLFLSL